MIKAIVILSIAACVSAGVVYDSAHVGAQSEQTVRGLGLFGQSTVSHQAKQVNSAFSSVSKHDTRVINPAVHAVHAAPVAYAQPAYAYQPQYAAAPVAYAAAPAYNYQQVAKVAAPVAYQQQVISGSPAYAKVAAPVAYAHAPAYNYQQVAAAPVYAHAAPVARVASPVVGATLIGSRYSPALAYNTYPGAAHLFFDGFGAHYEY